MTEEHNRLRWATRVWSWVQPPSVRAFSVRVWAVLALGFMISCKDDEDRLGELAQTLCQHDHGGPLQASDLSLELRKHVRQEDLDFLTGPNGTAGTAGGETTEREVVVTCEVRDVVLGESETTVRLTRKSSAGGAVDYAITFLKVAGEWRADYHLPEKDTARKTGRELYRDALKLVDQYDWDGAKQKLVEAKSLAPELEDLNASIKIIDDQLAKRIAGKWFKDTEKDAMTDQQNITVTLPSSTEVITQVATKRPKMQVRCLKGKLDVIIDVDTVVEGDIWNNSKGTYRFDSEPPEALTMTRSSNYRALFFKEPLKWMTRLIEHSAGKLLVEVPLFGRVPEALTFELAGADQAVGLVAQACGESPK